MKAQRRIFSFSTWKKTLCSVLIFFFAQGFSLEVKPWFGDCLEFHLLTSYSYSSFHRVDHGSRALNSEFISHIGKVGFDFSPTPEWSVDTELQLAESSQQHFNFRSFAAQARYLWLDDIVGDPCSLVTGFSARFTNTDSLQDISCPYHANLDLELHLALGKEFDPTENFAWRLWAYTGVGHANKGSPWVRGILAMETNYLERHQLGFFAEGINGYGGRRTVEIDHFSGYAKLRQKSIDLTGQYGLRLGVYGTLRFAYTKRVLAKSCPEDTSTFTVSYYLPFSL